MGFETGENARVRHVLDAFNNFSAPHLQLQWAGMSRSPDPANVNMVLQDLTGFAREQSTFPGGIRFKVPLTECYDCFFHVRSLITYVDGNRRLSDESTGTMVAIIVQKHEVDGTIAHSLLAVIVLF